MKSALPCLGLLAALVCMSGCITLPLAPAEPLPAHAIPPRIAVSSFENRSGFSGQWELGSGMADLLVSELVASRNFVVLERGQLDKVVNEISRQHNPLFRQEGRVEAGRLKNAQYMIRGVITDFSQVSGGSLWVGMKRWLLGGGGYTARVALALTIVDVESGEIVDSATCSAKARAREAYAKGHYKNVDFGGDRFFKTPLGSATTKAIRRGLKEIVRKVPRNYWQPMIAEINSSRILINGGRNHDVRVGQYYLVRGKGTPITDPVTGDVLDIMPGPDIGIIRIHDVHDTVAVAAVHGGQGFARGQHLEPMQSH